MALETSIWEPTLETDEDVRAFLDAAFEDGDPQTIAAALRWVARARGVGKLAEATGARASTSHSTKTGTCSSRRSSR